MGLFLPQKHTVLASGPCVIRWLLEMLIAVHQLFGDTNVSVTRDIIAIALFSGLRITSANDSKSAHGRILMRGGAGTFSNVEHPILCALLHYTPVDIQPSFRLTDAGNISANWMSRLWGDIPIAGRTFETKEQII